MEFLIVGVVCTAGLVIPIALARMQSQQRGSHPQTPGGRSAVRGRR
jgi:hypothetical protein